MPLFQLLHTINRLNTPDFVKWKYKKVWVNLLKYLYIIIHIEYVCTLKFKYNVCLEDLTSYYLETLFILSVSCICSKNPSWWYCIYLFPNLYLYFRNHRYVFNRQHDFQFNLPLEIFLLFHCPWVTIHVRV
jgi:hypothetical protein